MRFKQSPKVKPLLDEDQRRLLKAHSEILPIGEVAKLLGITTNQAIGQCSKYYFSYFS